MKIVNFFVAAISWLTMGATPSVPIKQCINSLPGDSYSFGSDVATQSKYLIVGDHGANHVLIYTRDQDDQWLRTREILPPKNSTAYKVGSGFGYTLALDGNNLIIGSFTVIKPEKNEVVNSKDFQENGIFSTATALYQTRLDKETEVKRIDLPNIPTKGVLPTGRLVGDRGKIGFIFSQITPGKGIRRINQVYVFSDGKVNALPEGKLEYRSPSKAASVSIYGTDIALHKDLLLVGIDRDKDRGGVWLFDLNSPQSKPQKLIIPLVTPAHVSVAISEEFIAISNISNSSSAFLPDLSDTTLIKNIATGSTKIIGGAGGVYLDSNILSRIRSDPDDDHEYTHVSDIPSVLEVFKLEDDAKPELIKSYENLERGLIEPI